MANLAACPLDAPATSRCEAEHPRKAAPISFIEARQFIMAFHYLRTLPTSIKQNYGLFDAAGRLMAVACYGPCHVARMPKEFLELRRLCRHPEHSQPLSRFLAETLRELKSSGVAAVLSWADLAAEHHGGIYQATNWVYTEPYSYNWNSHFKTPDGKIVDHREAFARFGTSSKKKMLEINPSWEAFLPPMKLRYLMPLNWRKNKCLSAMRAKERPYPKPATTAMPKRIDGSRRKEFVDSGLS